MCHYSTKPFFFLLYLLTACTVYSQPSKQDCDQFRNGTFYSYPKNSMDQYADIRNGDFQSEKNLITGDSSLWKINWHNDCTYTMQYISGNIKMSVEQVDFFQTHKILTKIETVNPDYYVYKTYIDKALGAFITTDTMWMQPKLIPGNNKVFEQVPANIALKKLKFSDTSSYALLYVYRPGRFTGSKGEYIVYFDDNAMCVSKNNTALIFKIFKEGSFKLSAKLFTQKVIEEKIEIEFGKKYYLNAGLKFTGTTGSGWRPDMKMVEEAKGAEGFLEAQ